MAAAATATAQPRTAYVDIVDISQLGANEELSEIDTGVTSGADPSEWDPINIDDRAQPDSCRNETPATRSGNGSAPAACESQPKKPTA